MGRFAPLITMAVSLLVSTSGATAARIYVDRSSPLSPENGTDWGHAYSDLQTALAAAAGGDEIWVANGVYKPATPATPGSRSVWFEMKHDVFLYGGFHGAITHSGTGGETSRAERDPLANPTILSGDINGDDTPNFGNRADNSFHVIHAGPSGLICGVDGFIIEGGNADGTNRQATGGGALVEAGSTYFVTCWFRGCSATDNGGAAHFFGTSQTQLVGCIVTGNRALRGAAVALAGGQSGQFNCTFTGNTSLSGSGNALCATSAGVFHTAGCVIWGNTDANGQGQDAQFGTENVTSVPFISNDIQGGTTGFSGGSISIDPGFVDADGPDGIFGTADDDVRLKPLSACIDKFPTGLMQGDLTDTDGDGVLGEKTPVTIAGETRFHDDPGIAGGDTADIGAQEFQGSSCVGNLNADSVINTLDLTAFLARFGQAVPPYTLGDFNGDGLVNTADLTLLLQRFGQTCPA